MSTATITTAIAILKRMPEKAQEQAISYLEQCLLDIMEEAEWEQSLKEPSPKLLSKIQKAKKEIKAGKFVSTESVFEQEEKNKIQKRKITLAKTKKSRFNTTKNSQD